MPAAHFAAAASYIRTLRTFAAMALLFFEILTTSRLFFDTKKTPCRQPARCFFSIKKKTIKSAAAVQRTAAAAVAACMVLFFCSGLFGGGFFFSGLFIGGLFGLIFDKRGGRFIIVARIKCGTHYR